MKIVLATVALLAALSSPSFAETAGTDALGSDTGSFRLSQKDPATANGPEIVAQSKKTEHHKMSVHSYGLSYRR